MNALSTFAVQIGEHDRIILDASKEHRLLEETSKAFYFYEVEKPTNVRVILRAALNGLIDNPRKFRLDRDYYTYESMQLRAHSVLGLADLSAAAAAGVHHKYTLVMEWRGELNAIPLNLPDREQQALDNVYLKVALRFARGDVRSTLSLKEKPVTLETLLKWNARLRAFDDNPEALIDGRTTRSGNKAMRFSLEEERFIDWAVNEYLQPTKPSIRKVWARLVLTIKDANITRKGTGQRTLNWPCYETLKRRIRKISRFIRHACRLGIKSAEKTFRASYGGQGYFRPGQRLEVDGWVCHLHALFEKSSAWQHLSEEMRDRLKTVRITFIVIIDVATRSIVGINFSWSENADAIASALRMALEDKSGLAGEFDCDSAWPQYGWGNFVHDGAVAYSEAELVKKVLKGLSSDQRSIPGVPWLRGTIEAFFRTIIADLLVYFTGQTGSNFVDRTELQTAEQASVTFDELVEKTIQWIVNDYHHTRHDDLGMTPFAAWHKFSQLAPPPPRHGPAKMIEIFGQRKPRTITHTGVSLAGAQFQSTELQRLRRLMPGPAVETWVDYENLGQILVRVPEKALAKLTGHVDGWMVVPGPKALACISLRHVNLVDADLELRFGYDKVTSEKRVSDFKLGLAQFARDAARLRLTEAPPSLESIEKRLAKSYHFALGDDDYCKEREALHAPIALAKGRAAAPGDDPSHTIAISFED